MATKSVNIVLAVKNKVSPELKKAGVDVKKLNRDSKLAEKQLNRMFGNATSSIKKFSSSTVKATGALAGLAGAFAFKSGLTESLDLQGYKAQLETSTKDTKKAAEIMKYAVNMANKTPFEGGQLIEASAKFEAMGMSAKKWLGLTGDMAGSTGKDFNQATEALIDAQSGELERLKEFGIKKSMIQEQADKMFGKNKTINNKGQIIDQAKFNQALEALMISKYSGGMDKLSKTVKGKWSTVSGIFKSGMASILGMSGTGDIIKGSIMEKIDLKVGDLAKRFEQWQSDGTIDKVGKQISEAFTNIYNSVSKAVKFIAENKTFVEGFAVAIGSLYIAVKVANAFLAVQKLVNLALITTNATLAISPIGWVIIAISALIFAGYLLIKNWDVVKTTAINLWKVVVSTFNKMKESLFATFTNMKTGIKSFIDSFVGAFVGIGSAIGGVFVGVGNIVKGALFGWVNLYIKMFNFLIGGLQKIKFTIPKGIPVVGGMGIDLSGLPKIPELKAYANGGLANSPSIFGEAGKEMAIPIKPNDPKAQGLLRETNQMMGNGKPSVVIKIDTFIGEESFVNRVTDIMINKLEPVLANM